MNNARRTVASLFTLALVGCTSTPPAEDPPRHVSTAAATEAPPVASTAAHTAEPTHEDAHAKPDAHSAHAHWSYDGTTGPEKWGELEADFSSCKTGKAQSPIDLVAGKTKAPTVTFEYAKVEGTVIDNGHTIQVNVKPGAKIKLGAATYDLVQFHFHTPSEHRVGGKDTPMEVHLVHKDAQGKLAVVGVLIDAGAKSEAAGAIWSAIPAKAGAEQALSAPIDPAAFVPKDPAHFHYLSLIHI